jgi:hypothetical protein
MIVLPWNGSKLPFLCKLDVFWSYVCRPNVCQPNVCRLNVCQTNGCQSKDTETLKTNLVPKSSVFVRQTVDEYDVIVVGGDSDGVSVEIFDAKTLKWTPGPSIPGISLSDKAYRKTIICSGDTRARKNANI